MAAGGVTDPEPSGGRGAGGAHVADHPDAPSQRRPDRPGCQPPPDTPGARGARARRDWLTHQLPDDSIRIPILLAVSFGAALDPSALRELLATSQTEHRRRLQDYDALDAALAAATDGEP